MKMIIRVDIDNTYGSNNFYKKGLNFFCIKTPFSIKIEKLGYLKHLKEFLIYCNKNKIQCKLFFRRCTTPTKNIRKLIKEGNHEIGWHVESCKTFNDFKKEYKIMCKKLKTNLKIYSKHGSGIYHGNRTEPYKSGYYHYPDYEEENLLKFGNKLKLKEFYGNGENPDKCILKKFGSVNYYTDMFWCHPEYRDCKKHTIDWLIKEFKKKDIVILIHPYNNIFFFKFFY